MSFLGSLASSLFFSYLCYASTFLTKDGIKFAIGLSTFSLILLVFIIEFLLRVLERFETDSLSSIDAVHLESDGTQLKAAAFYNSYEYISKLDSAKADENLSGKFWSELSAYRRRGMFSRDRQGAIIGNADVSGEFINVVEGLRVTPSQPSDFAGKLHIFGGSTIFAYEVSDGHTPSALLQKKFNESQIGFKVINHGVGGSTIGDCLRRLKLVNISANDVVLVLFGDNDIGINAPRKIAGRGVFRYVPLWGKLLLILKSHSRIVKWIYLETVVYQFTDFDLNTALLDGTISDYSKFGEYLRSLNIRVCFLLQPNLYTKVPVNKFEVLLKATYPEHWERTVVSGYRTLRESLKNEKDFVDISEVFNGEPDSYFLDWAHVNSLGNEILAEKMFQVLKNRGLI